MEKVVYIIELIMLIEVIFVLVYFLFKLVFDRPLPKKKDKKEKNSVPETIEISKHAFIWLTIILPIIYIVHIFAY